MRALPGNARGRFRKWGREGGEKRGQLLSPIRRREIAALAARARWRKEADEEPLSSFRLDQPSWDDPVFLEEVLTDGNLPVWRQLYRQIADHPFGATAEALERVLKRVEIYGAVPLWRGLLNNLRGGAA